MVKIQQKCEWEGAAIQSRTWNRVVVFLRQEAFVRQRPGLHSTGGPLSRRNPGRRSPETRPLKQKERALRPPSPCRPHPSPWAVHWFLCAIHYSLIHS